ncbi:IQ and AAA domain-containing protein 1-like [Diprion similis]|uniref:IQ and AAA domain-containing protein 1-like n=1 Tax=Diprion similis TaxID=362088 RepID=UPI001EF90397|nr:IQ and AAA domain-containing protein 1-like [Diprion similis]
MSHQFYSELWLATREDVEKLLRMDQDRLQQEKKGGKSKDKISGQLVTMYIRYRELIRRLALCHDQVCQSQKRELIKQVLNCAIGRMLEYKRQLVLSQNRESVYADDVLIPLKLTPDDIGWRKPSYFVTDRQSHLDARKKCINDLIQQKLAAVAPQDSRQNSIIVPNQSESEEKMSREASRLSPRVTEGEIEVNLNLPIRVESPEEAAARIAREELNAAVLLIQSHDRARKARIVGAELRRMNGYKKKLANGELVEVKHDKRTKVKAVVTMQKWWRSYATRIHLKERTDRLEAVLGMSIPSWKPHQVFDRDVENFKRRQSMQPEYAAATLQAISTENARRVINILFGNVIKDNSAEEPEFRNTVVKNYILKIRARIKVIFYCTVEICQLTDYTAIYKFQQLIHRDNVYTTILTKIFHEFLGQASHFNTHIAVSPTLKCKPIASIDMHRGGQVHQIRGPGLLEDITDEVKEWFLLWYNELGFFDAYPLAQAGGSILIATGQTLTPEEYHMEQMRKAEEAKKGKGKAAAAAAKAKQKVKQRGDKIEEPNTLKGLREANDDFLANWSLRDETGNPHQREYLDLITDKLCYELQLEMREVVDELMRLELAALEAALAKDEAESGGRAKGQKQQKHNKGTKNKKKKKSKTEGTRKVGKKKEQGPVPTIEELFSELVNTGIIREYPDVKMSDWKGDVSYQNTEAVREFREVRNCLGDVVQPIMEYCVLPVGSKEIHQVAPLVRSVSIVGLPRSGKSFLVNAICNEIGALLFDLSPKTVAEGYRTKKDLERLVSSINKVARAYPPSLLFVDAGHQPWWKKIPPEEKQNNPKLLAGPLTKLVKGIRPGDQILFLTTTDQPQKAGKGFMKLHDKFILIPLPDYNTLYLLYKELLMRYHGVDRNFDCSSLASLSVGHPLEGIRNAVEKVLTIERRINLKKRPLQPKEIMQFLISNRVQAQTKEYETLVKWEMKTPFGKRRSKAEAAETAARSGKKPGDKKMQKVQERQK